MKFYYHIHVNMPSQQLQIDYDYLEEGDSLRITIGYTHPTTGEGREITRIPSKLSFSKKHFNKELDAYIVQEAMSDLTDNRHTHDWIE